MPEPKSTRTLPTDRLKSVVDESMRNIQRSEGARAQITIWMEDEAKRGTVPQDVANRVIQCLDLATPSTTHIGLASAYLKYNVSRLKTNRDTQRAKYVPQYTLPSAMLDEATPDEREAYDQLYNNEQGLILPRELSKEPTTADLTIAMPNELTPAQEEANRIAKALAAAERAELEAQAIEDSSDMSEAHKTSARELANKARLRADNLVVAQKANPDDLF